MTTSIVAKLFCLLKPDRQTDGQHICKIDPHIHKMRALSYIGAEKITFPPKPDRQTDIHTNGRTLAFIE